jgi:UPF0716 family protein affecting phage T7 exclusion
MPIIVLGFFLAEVIIFWKLIFAYGFVVFLAYWLPSILGLLMFSIQSRTAVFGILRKIQQGEEPTLKVLIVVLGFLSAVGLILPFITTRVFALILFFPFTKSVLAHGLQAWFKQKVRKNNPTIIDIKPIHRE